MLPQRYVSSHRRKGWAARPGHLKDDQADDAVNVAETQSNSMHR